MRRRTFLLGSAATSAVLATGSLTACSQGGSSGSDTIRITLANHVWTENIKSLIPDFESETGLTVDITQLGEDQLSDQYNVKLNSGSSEIDVMMYRPLQEGKLFAKYGYLADLTDLVNGSSDYDWSDFQAGPVETVMNEGMVTGVPIMTEREALYYRKDILENAGISAPPATLDELRQMALELKQANPGMAGFVARTSKTAAVTQFSSYLYSMGGDFMTESGEASVNTPEAIAAYQLYGDLIREAGPDNVSTDMAWPDAMAIFTQGNAVFYTEADVLYKNATNPDNSKVSDVVGFAPFPSGPAGRKSFNIPSWGLAINAASENIDNAWRFIEWATSKEQTLTQQQQGVMSARTSVWDNEESTSDYPEDMVDAIRANMEDGVGHDRPVVIKVSQAREIVGQPIVDAITGLDVTESANSAQSAFATFLETDDN